MRSDTNLEWNELTEQSETNTERFPHWGFRTSRKDLIVPTIYTAPHIDFQLSISLPPLSLSHLTPSACDLIPLLTTLTACPNAVHSASHTIH